MSTRAIVEGARLLCLCAVVCALLTPSAARAEGDGLTLWHAYRDAEEQALDALLKQWNAAHPEAPVKALAVPYEAYASKLTNAIPRGHGPDVFIAAHERVGDWSRSGLLADWGADAAPWTAYHPVTVQALDYEGKRWGIPLATKSLALYLNPELAPRPPKTTDELVALAKKHTDPKTGAYGLAYETANLYMHAPWLFGFGGKIFDDKGELAIASEEVARSYQFVDDLVNRDRVVPEDSSATLVSHLFNSGKAAMVISGPWFLGSIDKARAFELAPLPIVSATGLPAKPFLTVEAAFVSSRAKQMKLARELAMFLATKDAAVLRAVKGQQPVATLAAYDDPGVKANKALGVFRAQLDATVPMPNSPKMRSVWEPANQALRQVLRGDPPRLALRQAASRFRIYTRPAPPPSPKTPYVVAVILALLAALGWTVHVWRRDGILAKVKANLPAYLYMAPAVLGMMVLIIVPFVVGSAVSLFAHREGEFTFVGLSNFVSIMTSADYGLTDPLSFYYTLGVTVAWTIINVFFHVSLGLALAMILREPWLKLRGVYRVLLIIPWAIPNYITALIWKGMFHKQYGAINALLGLVGVEPVSWFNQFSTAFAANLATNIWLGFPFMMVMTLGALQAIPRDLEEAAEVDGATRWQRFQHVIFPLLKPALIPAVILGVVWTFNAFNIIYLVSGGAPDGASEILISEAYKWAFSRQQQYGYAAAYSVLIFLVLLAYGAGTGQLKTGE